MKKTEEVVVEVTFDEFKEARAGNQFDKYAPKEQVLMSMFMQRGIRMTAGSVDLKPAPPVEIITDEAGRKFVIKQIQ